MTPTTTTVEFLRVTGVRTHRPLVVAVVAPYVVKWEPRDGWTCDCDEPGSEFCSHVTTVAGLLSPKVTGRKATT